MSATCLDRRTPLLRKLRAMISTAITLHGPQSPSRPLQALLLQEIDDTAYWWFNNRHTHDWVEDHVITGRDFLVPCGHSSQRRASWRETKRGRRRERMVEGKREKDEEWVGKVRECVRLAGEGEGEGGCGGTLGDLRDLVDGMVRWETAPGVGGTEDGDEGEDMEEEGTDDEED